MSPSGRSQKTPLRPVRGSSRIASSPPAGEGSAAWRLAAWRSWGEGVSVGSVRRAPAHPLSLVPLSRSRSQAPPPSPTKGEETSLPARRSSNSEDLSPRPNPMRFSPRPLQGGRSRRTSGRDIEGHGGRPVAGRGAEQPAAGEAEFCRTIGQATGRASATVPFASPSKPTSIDRRGESFAQIADYRAWGSTPPVPRLTTNPRPKGRRGLRHTPENPISRTSRRAATIPAIGSRRQISSSNASMKRPNT